jgi:hypothetical protein
MILKRDVAHVRFDRFCASVGRPSRLLCKFKVSRIQIEAGPFPFARRWDPLVEFPRRHSYPTYAGWSGEFAPHLMRGDSEGYSDVRSNRSRFVASNGRVSREAARELHYLERRRELLKKATRDLRF